RVGGMLDPADVHLDGKARPVVVSPSTGTGQRLHGPQPPDLAREFGDAVQRDLGGGERGGKVWRRRSSGRACVTGVDASWSERRVPWMPDPIRPGDGGTFRPMRGAPMLGSQVRHGLR